MSGGQDPGAIVATIAAALRHDPLYVDPSLASLISPAQHRAIEQHLAQAPDPVFVVLYPSSDNDVFGGQPEDLLARLQASGLGKGVYLSSGTTVRPDTYSKVDLHASAKGVPGYADLDGYTLDPIIDAAKPPLGLGAAFEQITGLFAKGPQAVDRASDRAVAAYEAQYARDHPTSGSASSSDSGSGGGVPVPAVVGIVLAVVVVVVLVALAAGRRLGGRGRGSRAGRTSTAAPISLPASAMSRIREAHDRRLEEQARSELLALGERIDATELGGSGGSGAAPSAAVTASWQAALDRYEVARSVLDLATPPDVLDTVGCLVVTRQAAAALGAARGGRAWAPPPTCYLDPLHGPAGVTRVVDPGGGGRDVPLCRQCRRDVDAGRDPEILDVERHGRAVHYFDSGVEPWATTGYGCFGDDLVVAWRRAART